MKILFVGNSHLSSLLQANKQYPEILAPLGEMSSCMVVGGTGPYVEAQDDFLVLDLPTEDWGVGFEPEDVLSKRISSFDVVLVGALGQLDAGYDYIGMAQTCGVLPEYGPTEEFAQGECVSDHCMREMIRNFWLRGHKGFKLIESIKQSFSGPIFVQPYPKMSHDILKKENWKLRTYYKHYLEAHSFFTTTQTSLLQSLSQELGYHLLDYPAEAIDPQAKDFTRASFMNSDLLHGSTDYGALVLQDFARKVQALSLEEKVPPRLEQPVLCS